MRRLDERPKLVGWRLALGLLASAATVSLLAATGVVVLATVGASLPWAIVGGLGTAVLASWGFAAVLRRLAGRRRANGPRESVIGDWFRRPIGTILVLFVAAVLSLSWLVPGVPAPTQPRSSEAAALDVRWLDRPDGSRLAVHVTRPRRLPDRRW